MTATSNGSPLAPVDAATTVHWPPVPPPPPPPPPGLHSPSATGARPLARPPLAYRPAGRLGVVVVASLVVGVASTIAVALVYWRTPGLVGEVIAQRPGARDELRELSATYDAANGLSIASWVVMVVALAVWLRRMRCNLEPLRAADIGHTSALAAGSWFIPLASAVLPWRIARRIWQASDPAASPHGDRWESVRVPPFLEAWGVAWLLNVVGAVGVLGSGTDLSVDFTVAEATSARTELLLTTVVGVIATVLAIVVVRALTRRQAERAVRLQRFGWLDPSIDLTR